MLRSLTSVVAALALVLPATGLPRRSGEAAEAGPSYVDITWMSVTNMYYELGPLRIVTDGYITRLPRDRFAGGGGGLAKGPVSVPDAAGVTRVLAALGGPSSVTL